MKPGSLHVRNWPSRVELALLCSLACVCRADVTNGLVAHWSFNAGDARDDSGNGHHGTPSGATLTTNRFGAVNRAFHFGGSTGQIVIQPAASFNIQDLTITAWVRREDPTRTDPIFSKDATATDTGGRAALLFRFDGPRLALWFHDGGWIGSESANTVTDTNWHHVAITHTASSVQFFIDGLPASDPKPSAQLPHGGEGLAIGRGHGSPPGTTHFDGIIDAVRFYNRVLSQAEIQEAMQTDDVGAPFILVQPNDSTILLGGDAFFSVSAGGVTPSWYQWSLNGVPMNGATNSSLMLTNVQSLATNTVSVTITNVLGAVTSREALLVVLAPEIDTDGDGLANAQEFALGTNPIRQDTDADGSPDGWEVQHGLNPLSATDAVLDGDGDGLNNLGEFQNGSDPQKPDTDSDGMTDGWEVLFGLSPTEAADALLDADGDGLSNVLEFRYGTRAGVGDQDSDADGLTDYQEVLLFGTNPLVPDTDSDGASDGAEIMAGRNPTFAGTRYYYDKIDRLVGAEYEKGLTIVYQYDGNGNIPRQIHSRADTNLVPDVWRILNGLTNSIPAHGPFGDADDDGWSNYQEWRTGTDPTDATSRPDPFGLPGTQVASLSLPFTPSNFVVGVGQLDGVAAEEIVIGADGDPGANTNYLIVLSETHSGWTAQRVDVGPFGVTSIAVGQPKARGVPAIYVGLRQVRGSGQVVEIRNLGSQWSTSTVANSLDNAAFVLGIGTDAGLLTSFATTNAPHGALHRATFTGAWATDLLDTNVSTRGLGVVDQDYLARLLDGGGVQLMRAAEAQSVPSGTQALKLDGTGARVELPAHTFDAMAQGTIEASIHLARNDNETITARQLDGTDTIALWSIGYAHDVGPSTPGRVFFKGHNGPPSLASVRLLPTDIWHQLAVVFSSTAVALYVNGILDSSTAGDYGLPSNPASGAKASLGAWLVAGGTGYFFEGAIGEIRVWNRQLSSTEIRDNLTRSVGYSEPNLIALWDFENGTAMDRTGHGFDGILRSNAVIVLQATLSTFLEPVATNRLVWRGKSLALGNSRSAQLNRPTLLYAFIDDRNLNGLPDGGDVLLVSEFAGSGANLQNPTLAEVPVPTTLASSSYGLGFLSIESRESKVLCIGEPQGSVSFWKATNSSGPLQRSSLSEHHRGKAWHALAGVKPLEPGEGLVGLRVDPASPNTCDVIFWPPQTELPAPASVPQTAPIVRVLPGTNLLGGLARVPIRLWDVEGNASLPMLQFQPEDSSNWLEAAIAYVDLTNYSASVRVSALPTGSDHVLWWDAAAVFPPGTVTNVLLRARAMDITLLGDWSPPVPYQVVITSDADGDGLPDAWEMERFRSLSENSDGNSDNDPFTNLQEYLSDTDPKDGASYLRITSIGLVPGGVRINWLGGVQATQYLQRLLTLGGTNDAWLDLFTNPPPTGPATSYTNAFPTNLYEFYRIRAVR